MPLEHRVFICLGTLKHNSQVHAWILTFSPFFDSVVLWDVQENQRFELRGRVEKKQIQKLKKFLYPEMPKSEKKNPKKQANREQKRKQRKLEREEAERKKKLEEKLLE